MNYQLVIQFKEDSVPDFDMLIEVEDELQRLVGSIAEVDGHDMGSGETNIFLFTSDPAATLKLAEPLLSSTSPLAKARIAFRELSLETYTVIWPEGSIDAFDVI